MGDGIKNLGTGVGALLLGELVGGISQEICHRVKVHRQELGGPAVGDGSGKNDTLLDLLLDVTVETVTLLLGIKLVESGFPSVTSDLHTLIFFIIGISAEQKDIILNLRKLTRSIMSDADTTVQVNPID